MRIYIVLFFLLGLLWSSCTAKKKLVDPVDEFTGLTSEAALNAIMDEEIDFQTFNTSANLDIDSPVYSIGANSKIRIIKDSLIWISVSKLGFEAGRALMTKDSVFAMERIQKTYIKLSIEEISQKIGVAVNFSLLQDFIMGNPYLAENGNKLSFTKSDSLVVLPDFQDYMIKHVFLASDFKLRTTKIEDPVNKVNARLTYDEYGTLNAEQNFSYLRDIFIDNGVDETSNIKIKFSKPELNIEKSIKFSIPDTYTPRDF